LDKLISFLSIFKETIISIGKWIECHSDFVTAGATAAIALFTLALFIATKKLWKASQEQSRDMKESINVARKAADFLQASERAYLFVRVRIKKTNKINYEAEELNKIPNRIETIITNHGKTPALILLMKSIIIVDGDNAPVERVVLRIASIPDSKSPIPPGTIVIDSGAEHIISDEIVITPQQEHDIGALISTLYCFGVIKYQDIFGNIRQTGFCWQYEQFAFFRPIQNSECNYHT